MNIYISHPFQNKPENKAKIEEIIKDLVKRYPEHTYISPVHTFGFLYDDVPYQQGIDMCINLLKLCDIMYVYGDYKNSKGCTCEIEWCQNNHKPYVMIG